MRTMRAGAAVLLAAISVAAGAQDFPDGKPIEMTVMFGAGSAADVTARHLADGMAKYLKAPVAGGQPHRRRRRHGLYPCGAAAPRRLFG